MTWATSPTLIFKAANFLVLHPHSSTHIAMATNEYTMSSNRTLCPHKICSFLYWERGGARWGQGLSTTLSSDSSLNTTNQLSAYWVWSRTLIALHSSVLLSRLSEVKVPAFNEP
jgi:hypothetical protein